MFSSSTFLASLAGSLLVHTASAGFSSECSDIALNTNWLTAECPNGAGTSISSAVYLPSWIENSQGSLVWLEDGGFSTSCDECILLDDSSTLQCYCVGTFASESGNSTLDLEQHIANYDGHLLSNLTGTPVVPSDSSIAVPSTLTLTVLFDDLDATCTESDSFSWEFVGPETCWALTLTGFAEDFQSVASVVNEGWTVELYNTSDCSGTVFGTLNLDNLDDCVAVDGAAYVKTTPLFNWD